MDPAYSTCHNLGFPTGRPYSVDYVYNPYLGIDRRSGSSAPAQPAAAPATGLTTASTERGQVDITAVIDGTVKLFLAGATGRWEVESGRPVSRQSIAISASLPATPGVSWSVSKQAGRGKVELVEKPVEENGYTAVIRIEDPQEGADTYRIRLQWGK